MTAWEAPEILKRKGEKEPRTLVAARDMPVLLLFLLLSVIFLLPGSLHLSRALLGYPGDSFQHAWFLWHFARAVSHGQNPYFTNLIFYPNRVNLAWSTLDPIASLLALPLSLTAGPVIAYNVSLILQLALAAFFAYLLCLRICGNAVASVIGGVCFGFSPWMMAEALGHLSLVTAFPIPLYFLVLHNVLRRPDGRWRDGIALGLALFLAALAHYNYMVFCILLSIVILGVDLAIEGWSLAVRVWRPLVTSATVFGILFLPLFVTMWATPAERPESRPFQMIEEHSADLFGWFVPSWNHLLFGSAVSHWSVGLFSAGYEGVVYLGPAIFVLAGIGLWTARRENRLWMARLSVAALAFWTLSLGPQLRVWGVETHIPGPALLFYLSPFGRYVSAPARFFVVAMLCVACLVAMGLAHLLNKFPTATARHGIVVAVSVLLALDLLAVPFPMATSKASERHAGFAITTNGCHAPPDAAGLTVVTVPELEWPYPVRAMWMQLADGSAYALADGYVSYGPDSIWREFGQAPILRALRSVQQGSPPPFDTAMVRASMLKTTQSLNLGAFVVFDFPQSDRTVDYLKQVLSQPGERQATCTIFDLRQREPAAELPRSSNVPLY